MPIEFVSEIILKKCSSGNSDAFASELPENPEDMFPQYYVHTDMLGMSKSSNHIPVCYPSREGKLMI